MTAFARQYGPWALITGASEGTGKAFAEQVAGRGVNCILVARREKPLQALAGQLERTHGVDTLVITADLAAPDVVEHLADRVGEREVGLLICNAGADTVNRRFLEAEVADWTDLVNRNVRTLVRSCHYFAAPMCERGRGGILLIGSGACYGGAGFLAVYAGSKAFALCFAEGLWSELRPHGVDVLHLVLGQTDTPAFRDTLARQGLPVPDNLASPEEVASLGLARLADGPIVNWGQDDSESGMAPNSAIQRRERVLLIDQATRSIFRHD